MPREEQLPSESEWMIMEVLWRCGHDLTSSEITDRLPRSSKMTQRMVRVLINRLCKKGMLTYTVDPDDSRVYHYKALRGRDECQKAKSSAFANSYFEGNRLSAAFALLDKEQLSEEQINELENLIANARKNK
ncbi:MAG: BlaI/MecI/CopY family transcriptional regulator [Butyrivibrio sp.]|uniref:BlaI/MecI/CopY family transcriptional regulator n=1 Tax=Butyrivibrio sp. TaxID=28121 RepID=UPI0025E28B67|nr:BlaI/MecI/CopY family transcriptional regulator [Butyrivibrio sp.]MCR5771794.1 BlaI/MecI/CopY family transcriptional regulator [Butyrivibrio sp.]